MGLRAAPILVIMTLMAAAAGSVPGQPAQAAEPNGPASRTVVLVPGVKPVDSEFDPLKAELRARGHEVIHYRYDWRSRLEGSADALATYLGELQHSRPERALVVIAHSMGGLVARRAFAQENSHLLPAGFSARLMTIASPFGGFLSADFARLSPPRGRIERLLARAFGLAPSYRDLGAHADFVQDPGLLARGVEHLKVETREYGKKRWDGERWVDDQTVLLREQKQERVDSDPQLILRTRIARGHVGVLNTEKRLSPELLELLDKLL